MDILRRRNATKLPARACEDAQCRRQEEEESHLARRILPAHWPRPRRGNGGTARFPLVVKGENHSNA